jgi:hypothetical protein
MCNRGGKGAGLARVGEEGRGGAGRRTGDRAIVGGERVGDKKDERTFASSGGSSRRTVSASFFFTAAITSVNRFSLVSAASWSRLPQKDWHGGDGGKEEEQRGL